LNIQRIPTQDQGLQNAIEKILWSLNFHDNISVFRSFDSCRSLISLNSFVMSCVFPRKNCNDFLETLVLCWNSLDIQYMEWTWYFLNFFFFFSFFFVFSLFFILVYS
jgi:hypothetical protein